MNAHTKQQQDKVFETDFIDSQKPDPTFAHLLALSHMLISALVINSISITQYNKLCSLEHGTLSHISTTCHATLVKTLHSHIALTLTLVTEIVLTLV